MCFCVARQPTDPEKLYNTDTSAGFLNLLLQKRWLQAVKGNRHSPSQYRHPRSVLHRRLEVSDMIKTLFTLMLHTGMAAQRQNTETFCVTTEMPK